MARRAKAPGRVELRKAAEAAEKKSAKGAKASEAKTKKTATKKKTTRRRSTKKKAVDQRLRMVWGVFDNSNQQVATFAYSERKGADKKAAELTDKGRGAYFVQPIKEPIPVEEAEPE